MVAGSIISVAAPIPQPGGAWSGAITFLEGLNGLFGTCNVLGLASTLLLVVGGLITDSIALCIDGPRLSELNRFSECCNSAGACADAPGPVDHPELRAQREAILNACLGMPYTFFYPDNNNNEDRQLVPNIACAGAPQEQTSFSKAPPNADASIMYTCQRLSPDDNMQNVYFYHTTGPSRGDPVFIFTGIKTRLQASLALDVVVMAFLLAAAMAVVALIFKTRRERLARRTAALRRGQYELEGGGAKGDERGPVLQQPFAQPYAQPYGQPLVQQPYAQAYGQP